MDIQKIMDDYKAGEITMEEANAKLKEVGANFFLRPLTAEQEEAKAKKEAERKAAMPKTVLHKPDMRRRKDLAGMTVTQQVKRWNYAVTYDENGYAVSAKKL